MDLMNVELFKDLHKYKGRVVLQGDNVKDESRYRAAFAEQGASASQMAAAMFLDTITKFLGMTSELSDPVSAYTEVKTNTRPDC